MGVILGKAENRDLEFANGLFDLSRRMGVILGKPKIAIRILANGLFDLSGLMEVILGKPKIAMKIIENALFDVSRLIGVILERTKIAIKVIESGLFDLSRLMGIILERAKIAIKILESGLRDFSGEKTSKIFELFFIECCLKRTLVSEFHVELRLRAFFVAKCNRKRTLELFGVYVEVRLRACFGVLHHETAFFTAERIQY